MASISFDKGTGWWSVRYFAGPEVGRVKKTLCKHPTDWSRSKPPRKPPAIVRDLARPFEDLEQRAKAGERVETREVELATYIEDYIATYRLTHKPNSVLVLKNATEKFLAWCAARKITSVQAVTVRVCDEWITHRLAEGAARSTVVTERGYLRPIWKPARKHRIVRENPWELAEIPGKPKEESLKYWTADELIKLFAVCEGWVRDYAVLNANTGIRVGALTGLRWRDIDFPGNRIVIPTILSKSGKSYAVPMSPAANALLARRWMEGGKIGPDDLVFPGKVTGREINRGQVWRRLGAAVRRAGIRDFGHYAHALRHSFAVALVGQGVSMRLIQELLGHGSIKTTEIYARVAPGKTQEVMERFNIPDHVPGQSGPSDGTEPGPATPPS